MFVSTPEAGVPSAGVTKVQLEQVNPVTPVAVAPSEIEVLPSVNEEFVKAEFGIPLAVTLSVGVVVLVATEGVSQLGQVPAIKFVTEPPPVDDPVKVQVCIVPESEQLPAPAE